MAWPSSSARTKTWGTEILIAGDLDGQFDILHTYNNDQLNGTSGHKHSGGTNDGPKIPLASGVSGTLPLANGGTGQTTLAALGNLFYPVGSIYINSSVSTNPATLLGFGTWTAITDRMIIGVGSTYTPAGATGGASTVTIAQANLPNINFTLNKGYANSGGSFGNTIPTDGNAVQDGSLTAASGGSGTALNVINPYFAAYIWQRTA